MSSYSRKALVKGHDSTIPQQDAGEAVMEADNNPMRRTVGGGDSNFLGEVHPKRSSTFSPSKTESPGRKNKSQASDMRDSDSVSDKLSVTRKRMSVAEIKRNEVLEEKKVEKVKPLYGNSLWLLSPRNPFRMICSRFVSFRYFDSFILAMILFSTLLLTLENPLDDPDSTKREVLSYIDIFVTSIFTFECLLKISVSGLLLNGNHSYLRNAWNIIDFLIVVFSIVSLSFSNVDLKFVKAIRMLRVLRPLRMISRNEGLKVAVQSLINAIPGIGNVLVISGLFILLFAILGTNFFKGRFHYCHSTNLTEIASIDTPWDCLNYGGEWVN